MSELSKNLDQEAEQVTNLLKGKVVATVWRHSERELGIQFSDGSRLFVDHAVNGIEVSITGAG